MKINIGTEYMVNITELKNYIKKLNKLVNSADFAIFGYSLLKKTKVDDNLVCILALLPDSFKKAMKKKTPIDQFPSVSSFSRLSKIICKPFFLSGDYYIFSTSHVIALIQNIDKNIERDIQKLEEQT